MLIVSQKKQVFGSRKGHYIRATEPWWYSNRHEKQAALQLESSNHRTWDGKEDMIENTKIQ